MHQARTPSRSRKPDPAPGPVFGWGWRSTLPEPRPAHSRLWDLVSGLPLILFNAAAALGFAILMARELRLPLDAGATIQLFSRAGSFCFFLLQAGLVSIRRLPLAKLPGVAPRALALLAAYSSFALLLLPRPAPSPLLGAISSALLFAGTAGAIATLAYLGRSYAILPQARSLVTGGPYRWCRHPLYLCEQLSLFGVSLQFAQPWASLIALLGALLQFPRMRNEERILAQAFPEYDDYRKRTAMIVPGLHHLPELHQL